MGDPAARVNRTIRAFVHTGVDYADPKAVRMTPDRGHKSQKACIVLYPIYLIIKALHLESAIILLLSL